MPRSCRRLALIPVLVLAAGAVRAQEMPAPPRPQLPPGADSTLWLSYYSHGIALLLASDDGAPAAFWWASRLDPSRAEPLLGAWAAILMKEPPLTVGAYMRGVESTRQRPHLREADSLRALAIERNPFVHRVLDFHVALRQPGFFEFDLEFRAWAEYSAGAFAQAAESYRLLLRRRGRGDLKWRRLRADALVGAGRFDDALPELRFIRDSLVRARERSREFASLAQLHYAIGRIELHVGRLPAARDAFDAATLDDAGYAYGHFGRAVTATASGDSVTALGALALAVEAAPGDPVLRYHRAQALRAAGEHLAARDELRRVIALEPWWAEPHYVIAELEDRHGDRTEASRWYARFIQLAPTGDGLVLLARERVGALAVPPR